MHVVLRVYCPKCGNAMRILKLYQTRDIAKDIYECERCGFTVEIEPFGKHYRKLSYYNESIIQHKRGENQPTQK